VARGDRQLRKVFIANRGEIAVRVIRAAAMLACAALRCTRTRSGRPVRPAGRRGLRAGRHTRRVYLDFDKVIARPSRPARTHPPRLRLPSENADFPGVIDADITWIDRPRGPSATWATRFPPAHRDARRRPLVPAPRTRFNGADEVIRFAKEYGLRCHQGRVRRGGRGMKSPAREGDRRAVRVAVREATSAFGRAMLRGALPGQAAHVRPSTRRHTRNVIVVAPGTFLQRRFQKLVEEAPAPFLTPSSAPPSTTRPRRSARRPATTAPAPWIPGRAGRPDLVPRGQHPAAGRAPGVEETRRLDLVREQFRIPRARAEPTEDPEPRATPSSSGSTARTPGTSCPAPGRSPRSLPGRARRAVDAGWSRLGDRRPVRLAAGQADRHRLGTGRRRGASRRALADSRSRAWPRCWSSTASGGDARRSPPTPRTVHRAHR